MEFADKHDTFALSCKAKGKWGMFFSFDWDDLMERYKAGNVFEILADSMPWARELIFNELSDRPKITSGDEFKTPFDQLLSDGSGAIFFDTEEEMDKAFDNTFGDESECDDPRWKGKELIGIYCLTCSPEGQLLNENT